MKTINEAAKKHADTFAPAKSNIIVVTGQDINDYVFSAFKKGVKFAQQWISINDELPEENKEIVYFVKTNDGYTTGIYFDKKWEIDSWVINLNYTPVTHWKKIELK
jgi:hypothetical protein